MSYAPPHIFGAARRAEREPAWARWIAFAIAAGCLAVLIQAALLTPNPAGMATHTAIGAGLGRCGFLVRTGLPCPSCGMTTSFAWLVRGNVVASAYVQPMGTLLAIAAAATVWGGFYVAFMGRPIYRALGVLPGRYTVLPLLLFAVAAWGWKILIHLNGRDGWR